MKNILLATLFIFAIGQACAEILGSYDVDAMELDAAEMLVMCTSDRFSLEVLPKNTIKLEENEKKIPIGGDQSITCRVGNRNILVNTSYSPPQPTNGMCAGAAAMSVGIEIDGSTIYQGPVVDYCRHQGISSFHIGHELRICGVPHVNDEDESRVIRISYGCIDYGSEEYSLQHVSNLLSAIKSDWP